MSDDNIVFMQSAEGTALAAGLSIAEYCKRSDVRHVMGLITVDRPDGRIGVVPISSAAGMVDGCVMSATANAIINHLMLQGIINAQPSTPEDNGQA